MSDERRLSRKRTIIMFKLFIPALAALSLAATAQAEKFDRVSVTVSYADLDLTSDAGAATLQRRLEAAADKACSRAWISESKSSAGRKACRTEALQGAAKQVAEARLPGRFVADSR